MKQACRDAQKSALNVFSRPIQGKLSTHPGLILQRFLEIQDDKADHNKSEAQTAITKIDLLQIAAQWIAKQRPLYDLAYQRYKERLQDCVTQEVNVEGRLVIGLGSASVLETGLTLHHTYGIPYLPATALKGLASHYCDAVWGQEDDKFRRGGEYHTFLFGTTEDSGHILFHDAWVTPDTLGHSLQLDIMTVHHAEYYKGSQAPTDFDNPTPIPFLSCKGKFYLALNCQGATLRKKWAELTLELLLQALSQWGIGGKTNIGYGRMETVVKSNERRTNG